MKADSAEAKKVDSDSKASDVKINGAILDIDYAGAGDVVFIRMLVKGTDGKAYEILDKEFKPYFYFVPGKEMKVEEMYDVSVNDPSGVIKPTNIVKENKSIFGKVVDSYKIFVKSPSYVPKLSAAMLKLGDCYEFDIPFAKRYVLDTGLFPLVPYEITATKDGNAFALKSLKKLDNNIEIPINLLCFDIEVYNPLAMPRPEMDPVIMISYRYISKGKPGSGVLTFKQINKPYVEVVKDETALIKRFMQVLDEFEIDIVTGYNSANFDIKYMLERARRLRIEFNISRFSGGTKLERHGLVERVKCAGRVHIDMYLVTRFIAVVGAAEHLMKLNSYTLKNVYEAISKEKKVTVEKKDIWKLWDGPKEDLEMLAEYNLNDSDALLEVYNTFIPIMFALSKITGDMPTDVAVSTSGQLVEFTLMRYAHEFSELIPNKPDETEIRRRTMNPIEGAYVKTPDPGIYNNLAVFDFRGLYPSIIISHNIDPSALCVDCTDFYLSPTGAKFDKKRKSTIPTILKMMIEERSSVKKAYKKDPNNIELGSKSQALKIVSNSFYGYLGYARSRWYSRDCAASVTAYGRQYIKETIGAAENLGFKVIYGDTDSIVMLLGEQKKDDTLAFMKQVNSKLPESMELELEDFYTRGVFVGKKVEKGSAGAKKKYALIAENGRIKIRGFELVRRDWSRVARDTQRLVLETILKEGSKEKAGDIVKDVVKRLKEGKVPLKDLVINTQLRKGIDSYDSKSPELGAAKKAVKAGLKTRDEVERGVIGYIITTHGNTISDKAELEEFATDYDPDYYINHQVLPATMRILKELDFQEDELKGEGKQHKLG
ncbi:MAG: DNA-directed DNA polymerase [Candidatus Micrarchaeales archaeon]